MLPSKPKNAARTRRILNLWPPLLFSGIQITELADDFSRCRARLRDWKLTRNMHGSQFGGSLFAMTDPIYSVMLNGIFGKRYYVWDKAAEIDFVSPGFGEVYLDCCLDDADIAHIKAQTDDGNKHLHTFHIRVFDKEGKTVATAKRVVYIRLKPQYRPQAA